MPRIVNDAGYPDTGRGTEMYLQPRLQRVGPDRVVTHDFGNTHIARLPSGWKRFVFDSDAPPEYDRESRIFHGYFG